MIRSWIKVPFLYLTIVAILGVFLRMLFVYPITGVSFKNFLHAHSHVALLGWLYSAFFILLISVFLTKEDRDKKTFKIQFWFSQISVLGMLVAFPIQGYATVSIAFSTLHIFLSYWFFYSFLKYAGKNTIVKTDHSLSFSFIKWSLWFMALSSLGPWSLGPIMVSGNGGGNMYYLAIYFYLHFQYNGWFTFASLGLFFWLLEKNKISYPQKESKWLFIILTVSCIPTYALSALWTQPSTWVYLIGGVFALLQLIGLVLLLKIIWCIGRDLKMLLQKFPLFLSILVLTSFFIKLLLQFVSAFPFFADLAYKIRNFIIGYLHLTLIGFISLFVFILFHQLKFINLNTKPSRWGLSLFLLGFGMSETLLFLQGGMYWALLGNLPYYYQLLFWFSLLMPLGTLTFLAGLTKRAIIDTRDYPQ